MEGDGVFSLILSNRKLIWGKLVSNCKLALVGFLIDYCSQSSEIIVSKAVDTIGNYSK